MDYEVMMNGNVRIGQMAPDFNATTTFGDIKLSDYRGKWLVLFSHPGDFTPVKSASLGEYVTMLDIADEIAYIVGIFCQWQESSVQDKYGEC